MKALNSILFLIIIAFVQVNAQKSFLQSGPMNGYSAMREVQIWVQTTEEADVQILYREKGKQKKYESDIVSTFKEEAFTAHITVENLEPGRDYNYELFINDEKVLLPYELKFKTQKLWQWREDAPDVSFVIGSCFYVNEDVYDRPGTPYGDKYEILDVIYNKQPEFMLWMGDNIYLREADWNARSSILKRYIHTRSYSKLQKLLGAAHHYATWDDHDFGPNNSDRSLWNKETTLEAFKLFWANPSYGFEDNPGVTTFFKWSDLDFFLLDDRYYRSPEKRETTQREILGEKQVEWLIDALTSSRAPFKFVVIGTQFLNPNAGGENHAMYPEERAKIIELITKEKIEGVIFLTGDVHRSEVTKLERENTYPLYEFTISPLTAGPSSKAWPNDSRIEESLVMDRAFGLINIKGKKENRILNLKIIDWQGKERYNLSINENELK